MEGDTANPLRSSLQCKPSLSSCGRSGTLASSEKVVHVWAWAGVYLGCAEEKIERRKTRQQAHIHTISYLTFFSLRSFSSPVLPTLFFLFSNFIRFSRNTCTHTHTHTQHTHTTHTHTLFNLPLLRLSQISWSDCGHCADARLEIQGLAPPRETKWIVCGRVFGKRSSTRHRNADTWWCLDGPATDSSSIKGGWSVRECAWRSERRWNKWA